MSVITSINDLLNLRDKQLRILCLYSGGLDSSFLLNMLIEFGFQDVVALNVYLGGEDIRDLGEHLCEKLGIEFLQLDRQEEFTQDFLLPAIATSALYLDRHPISASLSRPCIAKAAIETAKARGCNAILHTSTRSQNSLRRFNGSIKNYGFDGTYGSIFEGTAITRIEKISKLVAWGFNEYKARIFSIDDNLWGRCVESGDLDDPENVFLEEGLFACSEAWTRGDQILKIGFNNGKPISLDGMESDVITIIKRVREIGERYRLGRYIGLEETETGLKVQELHEMAAAAILFDAYRRLESAGLSDNAIREKKIIEQTWIREAVEGRWFGPLRRAAQAFLCSMASEVSGHVTYRLSDKSLTLTSLSSETPLYVRNRDKIETNI